MNRRPLLIAACIFAAVSLGLNVWLIVLRNNKPAESGPKAPSFPQDASGSPVLQPVTMDFSDTAFADGSWKLTDDPDPSVSLDKPFTWDEVKSHSPDGGRVGAKETVEHVPYDAGGSRPAGSPRPPMKAAPVPFNLRRMRSREEPEYLDIPMPDHTDPNGVRSKALLVTPPPR